MTISRVKFPWPPFFRIFIFFDEVFKAVCGTTYLMRDDGATVVNVRSSRVIWSRPNPTDVLAQPRSTVLHRTPRAHTRAITVPWSIPPSGVARESSGPGGPLSYQFLFHITCYSSALLVTRHKNEGPYYDHDWQLDSF